MRWRGKLFWSFKPLFDSGVRSYWSEKRNTSDLKPPTPPAKVRRWSRVAGRALVDGFANRIRQSSEASSRPVAPAGTGASNHLGGVQKPALHFAKMVRWPNSPALTVHKQRLAHVREEAFLRNLGAQRRYLSNKGVARPKKRPIFLEVAGAMSRVSRALREQRGGG
jgi:hypothetical protein